MLNHIVIMGRLTRDPELRRTQSGFAVTTITVAVDRDYQSREAQERQTLHLKRGQHDFADFAIWQSIATLVNDFRDHQIRRRMASRAFGAFGKAALGLAGRVGGMSSAGPVVVEYFAQFGKREIGAPQWLADAHRGANGVTIQMVALQIAHQPRQEGRHADDALGLQSQQDFRMAFHGIQAIADTCGAQCDHPAEVGQTGDEAAIHGTSQ